MGSRQRACGNATCQKKRRSKTQAAWRARNADSILRRRLRQRADDARAADEAVEDPRKRREAGQYEVRRPEPLWVPAALRRIPWDLAQDEIGIPATDFLALTARLLVGAVKDQIPGKGLN